MIDNFELIKPLLHFDAPGNFYFVQVIQRKKDHKAENIRLGRNNNARLIKAYYIYSLEKLEEHKAEMIKLADIFNARIGINLNPRNDKKVALDMLERLASSIKSEVYDVAKTYNSACGASLGTDKTWLVDLDTKDPAILQKVIIDIEVACEPFIPTKIIAQIPTKNGIHLITRAFNSKTFGDLNPEVSIHKNNPTVLYIPDSL